jgi:hypothetical protein
MLLIGLSSKGIVIKKFNLLPTVVKQWWWEKQDELSLLFITQHIHPDIHAHTLTQINTWLQKLYKLHNRCANWNDPDKTMFCLQSSGHIPNLHLPFIVNLNSNVVLPIIRRMKTMNYKKHPLNIQSTKKIKNKTIAKTNCLFLLHLTNHQSGSVHTSLMCTVLEAGRYRYSWNRH